MFYACKRIDYESEWLEIGWRTNFIWYRVGQVYAARSATRLLAIVVLDEGMVVDVVELAALRFARLYGRYQLSQFVADVVVPWYEAYGVSRRQITTAADQATALMTPCLQIPCNATYVDSA